jgi:hypothetical protein
MSYASMVSPRSRTQRKCRRRSILNNPNINNMDTIFEETRNELEILEMNWNSFVDPRRAQGFDRKVKQRYERKWEDEQNLFDDEMLKSMFHWDPDHYSKMPNKRKNRNRNSNSGNSNFNSYDSNFTSFDNCFSYDNYDNSDLYYQNQIQNNQVQNYSNPQNFYQVQTQEPDSIKQFGPPPGLSRPASFSPPPGLSKPLNSKTVSTTYFTSNFSDSASDSERSIKTIPSDEELLKDRSAIFATDFSSDSNFSDNYNSDSDIGTDNTGLNNVVDQLSGFKLNPTAQVFQPRFS